MNNPFAALNDMPVAMDSFVAMASLFGYPLVDRSGIRRGQDSQLAEAWMMEASGPELPFPVGQKFYYGSVDWMLSPGSPGKHQAYIVEVNGSNAAGLTDVPLNCFQKIVEGVGSYFAESPPNYPAVVINSYTGEKNINVHERVALADGIRAQYPDIAMHLVNAKALLQGEQTLSTNSVNMVTGPITFLTEFFSMRGKQLCLCDQSVIVIINDLTVDRITKVCPEFDPKNTSTLVMNQIHPFSNFKAAAYEVMHRRIIPDLKQQGFPIEGFRFWQVDTEEALKETCRQLVEDEKIPLVLKPYSSSVGVGIQFLTPQMSKIERDEVIQLSLNESSQRYQKTSDIFPYTLCEFVETGLAQFPNLGLNNRKFDIRIFVVKTPEGGLRAIPAVAKLASSEYDLNSFYREGLQTNTMRVTQEAAKNDKSSVNQVFWTLIRPLNNRDTLLGLGMTELELKQLCQMSLHAISVLCDEI
ncbi:MAG: hypothetical protein K2X01_04075 [Cyanobacteria bacterium]|nr:hypothetical protein [Cyanobacteriota bacterium]